MDGYIHRLLFFSIPRLPSLTKLAPLHNPPPTQALLNGDGDGDGDGDGARGGTKRTAGAAVEGGRSVRPRGAATAGAGAAAARVKVETPRQPSARSTTSSTRAATAAPRAPTLASASGGMDGVAALKAYSIRQFLALERGEEEGARGNALRLLFQVCRGRGELNR